MRPAPHTPTSLTAPDVYGAIFDFIAAFVTPPFAEVVRGDQNRVSLPEETNEYILITKIVETRRGSNVHSFEAPAPDADGTLSASKLTLCDVQIDVRSDKGPRAQEAASLIELWARDEIGIRFFQPYGISVTGCTSPQDMAFIDESNQFVKRFMVTLSLEYWETVSIAMPFFDDVTLKPDPPRSYFENIDVHHPPQET